MRKILALVLACALSLSFSAVIAENADTLITIEQFSDKYNEVDKYITTMMSATHLPTFPKIDLVKSIDGITVFTMSLPIAEISGEAFGDTGVISKLSVAINQETAKSDLFSSMKIMGVLFAMSNITDFGASVANGNMEALTKMLEAAKKSAKYNGYEVRIKGEAKKGTPVDGIEYTFLGNAPAAESVINPRSTLDYYSFFTDKLLGIAQEKLDELKSAEAQGEKTLDSGDYVVGQHIAAGEYSVKAVQYAFFGLTRSGDLVRSEALGPDNRIGRIVLQAGDDVEISGGSVVFTPLK